MRNVTGRSRILQNKHLGYSWLCLDTCRVSWMDMYRSYDGVSFRLTLFVLMLQEHLDTEEVVVEEERVVET